jgi:uncharacterized protein with HEPN domain
MQHRINKYLFDIQTSIDSIGDYLGPECKFETYTADKKLRRAVERELEIIGEAVNKILLLDPEAPIDNARKIIGLRNRVIHAYDNVDNETVWGVLTTHLPILKKDVDKIMK